MAHAEPLGAPIDARHGEITIGEVLQNIRSAHRRCWPPTTDATHPYALMTAGRWRAPAAIWQAAGCEYEHAVAIAESTDLDDLRAAVAILDALGAEPFGSLVRARL